jgi:hypothetical protein
MIRLICPTNRKSLPENRIIDGFNGLFNFNRMMAYFGQYTSTTIVLY